MTTFRDALPILDQQSWETLRDAHKEYASSVAPEYDEVLHEVAARISETGSAGPMDIGALTFWKRLRADTPWVRQLMVMPDAEVRSVTGIAVRAVNDTSLSVAEAAVAGRRALGTLPGCKSGDALASALLFAAAPGRMAVYDQRAQRALIKLGLSLTSARGRYGRYRETVEALSDLANSHGRLWIARDVDVALYMLGARENSGI